VILYTRFQQNGQETWDIKVEIHLYPSEEQEDHPVHFKECFTCQATICKACPYQIYCKIWKTV